MAEVKYNGWEQRNVETVGTDVYTGYSPEGLSESDPKWIIIKISQVGDKVTKRLAVRSWTNKATLVYG